MYATYLHVFRKGLDNEITPLGVYSTLEKAKQSAHKFLHTYVDAVNHHSNHKQDTCYFCSQKQPLDNIICEQCINMETSCIDDMFKSPYAQVLSVFKWQHNHCSFSLFDTFDDSCHPGVCMQILQLQLDQDWIRPQDIALTTGDYLLRCHQYQPFYSLLYCAYAVDAAWHKICNCRIQNQQVTCNFNNTVLRFDQDWLYLYACYEAEQEGFLSKLEDVFKYCLYGYLDDGALDSEDEVDND